MAEIIPYDFTRQAERMFAKLSKNTQQQIIEKLEHYLAAPKPLDFARKIAGDSSPSYRFYIGDYRVIFDWETNRILITKVGHRKDVYRP